MANAPLEPFSGVPDNDVPVIFVDGVANVASNKHTVKLLFYRTDPSVGNQPPFKNVAVAQIICDFGGFSQIMSILNAATEGFVDEKQINPEHLDLFGKNDL